MNIEQNDKYSMWLAIAAMFKNRDTVPPIENSVIAGNSEVEFILNAVDHFPVYKETVNRLPFFTNPLYCIDHISASVGPDINHCLIDMWEKAQQYVAEDAPSVVEVGTDVADDSDEDVEIGREENIRSSEMESLIDTLTPILDCESVIVTKQLVWLSGGKKDYMYYVTAYLRPVGFLTISGRYDSVMVQLERLLIEADTLETRNEAFDDGIPF